MGNLAVAFRGRRRSLTAARQIHCVNPWIGRCVTSAHMALCDNKRQLARTRAQFIARPGPGVG